MSDKEKQGRQPEAVPFFARFLEGQGTEELSDEEMQAIAGGADMVTLKYPSDSEEGGVQTRKYPSDSEDGGGCGGMVTEKFPSDNEDVNVTLKYPSDGDDNIAE
ncbi:microviridin/marinostatin family tricyclic proteinase inhibitor [Kamptonema formosum]|uniref:microviridin/marinostatin family tricyclic proteinase inhibitor n=1 Tax=Kamptonema formosum TaxID=331992 RepID=UPI00034B9AAF|nr:microviridin/marinostatin family tricyclic proteinase inhibitor [Oscillatoria sp. PCC 10802]